MKYFKIILLIIAPILLRSQTDFKFDDVVYKTLYPKDLCTFLQSHPKTQLIDVRSPGEFSDTSMYQHLNIGHLKNARNIWIDSLPNMLPELKKISNEPIILYCSHSQRSRRVSKTLMENGFTEVYNLNGGMTWMNQADEKDFPCKKEMIIHALPYKSITALDVPEFIKNNKGLVIIDVRPITEFEGKDTVESLNLGRLKNAINLPADELKKDLSKLNQYKNKTILIYDNHGSESNPSAAFLVEHGFKNVYHLLGGISEIVGKDNDTRLLRKELLSHLPSYVILNVRETVDLLTHSQDVIIIDTRPAIEFTSQTKEPWKNLGNIKGAINIPQTEFDRKFSATLKNKKQAVVIYGTDAAKCCRKLKEEGYENVSYFYGGMWGVISVSKNVKEFKNSLQLLENNEGFY